MSKKILLAMGCAVALLAACGGGGGGGGGGGSTPVTAAVPSGASTSSTEATAYVAELSTEPESSTDSLEPIADLPAALATDDTAEPAAVE